MTLRASAKPEAHKLQLITRMVLDLALRLSKYGNKRVWMIGLDVVEINIEVTMFKGRHDHDVTTDLKSVQIHIHELK